MSMRADIGVATLAFVTRVVKGKISSEKTVFNERTRENEKIEAEIVDPVIIFFPTKSCVVLPMDEAERMGYLKQPTILNFDQVKDAETIAGRFKYSIIEEEKRNCWKMMEDALIQSCISRGGYPIPRDAEVDDNSIFLNGYKRKAKEQVEKVNAD